MIEKKLKSGRKLLIKELSVDTIDEIKDMVDIVMMPNGGQTIKGLSRQSTAFIRSGLGGGDFSDWKPNGGQTPDNVLKQLSADEKEELRLLIEETQTVNPSKPSN